MLHPISLLGDAGILLFTIFLGWGLIKPRKKFVLFIGATVFIMFISAPAVINLNSYKYVGSSSIEKLKTLPYLVWMPEEKDNIEKKGVTKNKVGLTYNGFNIYGNYDPPLAYLIDMSGKVVHTWSHKGMQDEIDVWSYVKMCDNGDLLTLFPKHRSFLRVDWDSNVKWIKEMPVHHDIAVAENKDIYTLIRKSDVFFNSGLPLLILNDYIIILSSDGEIKKKLSLFKILKKEIPPVVFAKYQRWIINPKNILKIFPQKLICLRADYFDIFHTNTIEIIDRDIDGVCKKGDLLICVRELDLIGIVDIEDEKLVWQWGAGNLDKPHHPTLLENGNILIFDNGYHRGYSRIIELNPLTKNIVWEYKTDPPDEFFSADMGASQRLPNGNTLITESDRGRVFEITQDGEIVWEFYNPHIKKEDMKRMVIYRMMRITDPENYPCLRRLKKGFSPLENKK
ncbi:MAG: aryl-sulfate sulfotransferase [Candidatus Omnitrophica bacterium]|nr:aryl-sulfate sulfotransferase [Candidatus Omnitrophota bacterium]